MQLGEGREMLRREVQAILDSFDHPPQLTQRQVECLLWTEQGKSARDIGVILGISRRTVEEHIARACEVLGVRTRVQAVVQARRLGLLG